METVEGEVTAIDKRPPMRRMRPGVHVTLKTERETIRVHLGPAWYVENQDVQIAPGDRIQVKGSRITFEGKPTIIAAEITKGRVLLRLRDANGFPFWSGWRRRV